MIIRKLLLALISVLISTETMAEWTKVGSNAGSTIYADLATIRKTNNGIKMWSLFDYKSQQMLGDKIKYLSVKNQSEYDCVGEQHRPISYIVFNGNIGDTGQVVYSDHYADDKWYPISPQSLHEILWKTACNQDEASR